MVREYDTRTRRVTVTGECPECEGESLTYSRRVTRTYQLHITCETCGAVVKAKGDPTGLFSDGGVEYEEIVRKVDVEEFDLESLFALDEATPGDSIEIDTE